LVTKLNGSISNVFLMGSDLTPSEDGFLGNHLIEKDTLDIICDVYVGYCDSKIEAEPARMMAYFSPMENNNSKEGNETGGNGHINEADVTAFLELLNSDEH